MDGFFVCLRYQFNLLDMIKILLYSSILLLSGFSFSQQWIDDPSFSHNVLNGAIVSGTWQQPDGKIIIAGSFNIVNGPSNANIARLNADGTLDTTFTPVYLINNPPIQLQPDGKIIAGGGAGIRRYLSNGELDSTFSYLTFVGSVNTLSLQDDGKIIVGGDLGTYNGQPINNLVRLNPDGTLDNTFSIPPLNQMNSGNIVSASFIQSDQKIIFAGGFGYSYNGNAYWSPCRLNPDGSIDTTFLCPGANGTDPVTLKFQPDGKLLVGSTMGVVRLNPDGTFDNTFASVTTNFSLVRTLEVLPNGKIFMGGQFLDVNGQYASGLALLNPNGTLGNQYGFANQFTGTIYSIKIQNNDRILVAGGMNSNTSLYGMLTRLMEDVPQDSLSINTFSLPSSADSCTGSVGIFAQGVPYFTMNIGTGVTIYTEDFALFDTVCPGIYTLTVTDGNSNTVTSTIVVPQDSNYVFNNPYQDSIPLDSLGYVLQNCEINYPGINAAFIDSIWADSNAVTVIWNIVDSSGSHLDTVSYGLNDGNGVYWLQMSVFCPFKSVEKYFTVTEAIYFEDGQPYYTAGVPEETKTNLTLYPNPTNSDITVCFSGPGGELTVYDLQGKVVLKNQIRNQETVSLEHFDRGVYLFNFKNSQGQNVQRVVKN